VHREDHCRRRRRPVALASSWPSGRHSHLPMSRVRLPDPDSEANRRSAGLLAVLPAGLVRRRAVPTRPACPPWGLRDRPVLRVFPSCQDIPPEARPDRPAPAWDRRGRPAVWPGHPRYRLRCSRRSPRNPGRPWPEPASRRWLNLLRFWPGEGSPRRTAERPRHLRPRRWRRPREAPGPFERPSCLADRAWALPPRREPVLPREGPAARLPLRERRQTPPCCRNRGQEHRHPHTPRP